MEGKFGEVNYYLTQLLSGHAYFCKYLFKMGKMTRPICINDDAEQTFFHCKRWRLERRNLEPKVGVCTVENFCDVILDSLENWNSIASYTKAILKSKKIDLNERSRMDVLTPSQILLLNTDVDMDIKGPNGQGDSTSK